MLEITSCDNNDGMMTVMEAILINMHYRAMSILNNATLQKRIFHIIIFIYF